MKELTNATTSLALSEQMLSDINDALDNIGRLLKDIFKLLKYFNIISRHTLTIINKSIDVAISDIELILSISNPNVDS
ncbi:hypothetical protein [Xenorhabdus sp. IM139775]|uniref:hypothetical protein n=1 Tax=Xenorhabdus sp. IM139775 TaxID=3025876 RepID=UPI002358D54A|nr:hypothetical protein [Xenorhabdus sp. IM139775]MDC9593251.1 hypothetical protein [Xenorhabdus sp. IM139775]